MTNALGETLKRLALALDSSGVSYAIGGSMASSVRGVLRATFDLDIIALITPVQAARLAQALGPDWYADLEQMNSAIAAGRSFNVIDMRTGNKVDVFPATEEFHLVQLQRSTPEDLPFLNLGTTFPVTSSEDILLAKLRWYRAGGCVSERQWRDITGLLSVNPNLDFEYLNSWAAKLEVTDLLKKACADADF